MKLRLAVASAAVAVVGLAGVASADHEEPCAEGPLVVSLHVDINGNAQQVCLPEDLGPAPTPPAP